MGAAVQSYQLLAVADLLRLRNAFPVFLISILKSQAKKKGAWVRGFACLAEAMSFEAKAEKSDPATAGEDA